jgi:hypothetical protein
MSSTTCSLPRGGSIARACCSNTMAPSSATRLAKCQGNEDGSSNATSLDDAEEAGCHVFRPAFVGVEAERGVGDGVLDIACAVPKIRSLRLSPRFDRFGAPAAVANTDRLSPKPIAYSTTVSRSGADGGTLTHWVNAKSS